jgi:hypothetical protein
MTSNDILPWFTTNALCRWLHVEEHACTERVDALRARVGISHWRIERALHDDLARRTAISMAFPTPRGKLWAAAVWLYDFHDAANAHAGFSACVAQSRDPHFFDRPSWPADLVRLMSPAPGTAPFTALVTWTLAMAGAASARAAVRQATRGGLGAWWSSALYRGGAAALWGRVEAAVATKGIARGVEAHLRRAAMRPARV